MFFHVLPLLGPASTDTGLGEELEESGMVEFQPDFLSFFIFFLQPH